MRRPIRTLSTMLRNKPTVVVMGLMCDTCNAYLTWINVNI